MRSGWLALAIPVAAIAGQQPAPPHIVASVEVSRATGIMRVAACLTNRPAARRVTFILNAGFNVRIMHRGDRKPLRYLLRDDNIRATTVGEGLTYVLRDSVRPEVPLCVEYVGAFPVFAIDSGAFAFTDYKGFIAFNGKTVRAAEQTKWYPIPYDSTLGPQAFEAMTYDVEIRCDDCRGIYVNGSTPQPGPRALFHSAVPVSLLLFAGEITWNSVGSTVVINSPLPERSVRAISTMVDSIGAYYARFIGIAYGQPIVFLTHRVIENNPRRRWGFVTYPTVAFSGDGLAGLLGEDGRIAPFAWSYLGHEMAHYYFGALSHPTGPLAGLTESFAEYLSLKIVRRQLGDSAVRDRIAPFLAHWAQDSTSVPLDSVVSAGELSDRYLYEFAPVALLTLDRLVGERTMSAFLRAMVSQPSPLWDYTLLRETALRSGVSARIWSQFEDRCVHREARRRCVPD
jgi:hypothetical protein